MMGKLYDFSQKYMKKVCSNIFLFLLQKVYPLLRKIKLFVQGSMAIGGEHGQGPFPHFLSSII